MSDPLFFVVENEDIVLCKSAVISQHIFLF